jgi:hypothetical protein
MRTKGITLHANVVSAKDFRRWHLEEDTPLQRLTVMGELPSLFKMADHPKI